MTSTAVYIYEAGLQIYKLFSKLVIFPTYKLKFTVNIYLITWSGSIFYNLHVLEILSRPKDTCALYMKSIHMVNHKYMKLYDRISSMIMDHTMDYTMDCSMITLSRHLGIYACNSGWRWMRQVPYGQRSK